MKTKLIALLLLSFCHLICLAQEKEAILSVVQQWNELHNRAEPVGFKKLYASNVLFYGRYSSREKCFQRKKNFLSPYFSQQIITPVTLTYFSSGTIKCDFTKQTTYKNLVKEHACYLLVEQQNGAYLITGESDVKTDEKSGVQLHLGGVVKKEGQRNNTVLMALFSAAALLVTLLVWYKRKQRKREQEEWNQFHQTNVSAEPAALAEQPAAAEQVRSHTQMEAKTEQQITPQPLAAVSIITEKEKGDAFERYIVSRFSKEYFELIEWRSDKYHEGIFATSSMLPDLEYQFKAGQQHFRFAVECKWRADFYHDKIDWAKHHQLITYRQYERERFINVFVAIGIGGSPDHPDAVYVIPLREIQSNVLTSNQLKKYRRPHQGNFFLDGNQMTLT